MRKHYFPTYQEVGIFPSPTSPGVWIVRSNNDPYDFYDSISELLGDMERDTGREIYELGETPEQDLPKGALDISGRIENEPYRVYCYQDHTGTIGYFGIAKVRD